MIPALARFFVTLGLLSAACHGLACAEETADANEDPNDGFVVRIVDEQGRAVPDATITTFAHFDARKPQWQYFPDVKSDAQGLARFAEERSDLGRRCLSAWYPQRKLVGFGILNSDGPWEPVPEIVLHPGCEVSGRLTCRDLEQRGKPLGFTNVYTMHAARRTTSYFPTDGSFQLLLPPGEHELQTYGTQYHFVGTKVHIASGQSELKLAPIDMPATRFALLQGEPAPPLRDVAAWKNGGPLKLSDFKGQCVLLDFWGYWCGPCVAEMPEVMKLHDTYHDRGLVVIGVHVDLPKFDDLKSVDTVAELDAKLAEIRKEEWSGRDIPFPVALVLGNEVPYGPRVADKARCPLSADYGIFAYPTQVLIDRAGRVVGLLDASDPEEIKRLEKVLAQESG